ncbi:hypothetical protein ICE98_03315 [Lactococcus lactis]|nr:hypothetical protein [Lactococcus lactis]
MDYEKFFNDVKDWILECNSQAIKLGFGNDDFVELGCKFTWRAEHKIYSQPLVMKQTNMLLDWLEDTWEEVKNGKTFKQRLEILQIKY